MVRGWQTGINLYSVKPAQRFHFPPTLLYSWAHREATMTTTDISEAQKKAVDKEIARFGAKLDRADDNSRLAANMRLRIAKAKASLQDKKLRAELEAKATATHTKEIAAIVKAEEAAAKAEAEKLAKSA